MPGEEQCRFCQASGICQARAKRNLELFDAQVTENMTPDDVGAILKRAADIPNWLKALEAEVQSALLSGKQAPGWKIVEGRSIRRFADEQRRLPTGGPLRMRQSSGRMILMTPGRSSAYKCRLPIAPAVLRQRRGGRCIGAGCEHIRTSSPPRTPPSRTRTRAVPQLLSFLL